MTIDLFACHLGCFAARGGSTRAGVPSHGSAALGVPSLEGFLAWVVRTLRAFWDHAVQYEARGLLRKSKLASSLFRISA